MVVEFPWFEHRSFSFFSVFLFFIVFSTIVLLTCILMYYKNLAECVKSRNSEKYMLKESSWVRYHLALVVVSLISQHWSRVLLLLDVPHFRPFLNLSALSPTFTVAQFISPPSRFRPMTFEKVGLFRLLTNA